MRDTVSEDTRRWAKEEHGAELSPSTLRRPVVHSRCVRASCAQGLWPCGDKGGHRVRVGVRKLVVLDREMPWFWRRENEDFL